jgi:E3 ubiquitin-protein ligase BRE1
LYCHQVDEECRAKCEEAEAQVAKTDLDIQRIRSERDLIHQQLAVLESTQTKHNLALRELQELNSGNEHHIKALESEVKRLQIAVREVQPDDMSLDDLADQSADGLKAELQRLRSQFSALNAELESMQMAVTKFRMQATKKTQDIVGLEQEFQKLREIKNRLDSNRFSEKTVLETKKMECDTMRRQSNKSAEIIAQLKEAESKTREMCGNLERQMAEYRSQVEHLTESNRELKQRVDMLNGLSAGHDGQLTELKKMMQTKDAEASAAMHLQREAEAEASGLRSKLADLRVKVDEQRSKTKNDGSDMISLLKVSLHGRETNGSGEHT